MYLAMLYANRIVAGKYEYANVPEKLKEQVKTILIDAGLEELTK